MATSQASVAAEEEGDIGRVDVQEDEEEVGEVGGVEETASTPPPAEADDDGDIAFSPTHSRQGSRRLSMSASASLASYDAPSSRHSRAQSLAASLSEEQDADVGAGDVGDMLPDEEGAGIEVPTRNTAPAENKRASKTVEDLKKRFEGASAVGDGPQVFARRGTHHRIDSVPPQRYDVEQEEPVVDAASYDAASEPITIGVNSLSLDHDTPTVFPIYHTHDVGFEEVTLEANGSPETPTLSHARTGPYGDAGNRFARSSVEIRQDSLESGTWAARKARKAASSSAGDAPLALRLDLADVNAGESSNAALRRASASEIRRTQASDGSSSSNDITPADSETGGSEPRPRRRSAAGRYRGRRSAPSSRSESPASPFRTLEPAHPPIPSALRIPQDTAPPNGGVSMVVADENGELQVVSAPVPLPPPATPSTEGVLPSEKKSFTPAPPSAPPDPNGTALSDAADRPQKRQSRGAPPELKPSLTRMAHLPPKERKEESRHLATFEEMMRQSKAAERAREDEERANALRRDELLRENTRRWNDEILPSWTRARKDDELRTLWWQGAPPSLRPRVWALAVGNAQMLPRNLLQQAGKAVTEAPDAMSPTDVADLEADMQDTLPSLKLYQRDTGPLWEDLHDVLLAFVMVRLDQLKERDDTPLPSPPPRVYEKGAASLAGMLLTNLTPAETLVALINLIASRPWLALLFSLKPAKAELAVLASAPSPPSDTDLQRAAAARADVVAANARAHERVFDTVLADQMPKVYAILSQHDVRAAAFVTQWVRRLFTPLLHFDTIARLWDVILLEEGDAILFRIALALMHLLEARLWVPDTRELASILVGNNRAALAAWHRALDGAGGSAGGVRRGVALASLGSPRAGRTSLEAAHPEQEPHEGGASGAVSPPPTPLSAVEADPTIVPLDNLYAQYGISEARLFRELEEQRAWWKDSTLERTMNRELGA